MLQLKRWLTPPVFPDDEIKTRRAHLLHSVLINIVALIPVIIIGNLLGGRTPLPVLGVDVLGLVSFLVLRAWLQRGQVRLASVALTIIGLVLVTIAVANLGTVRAPATAMYILVVITGGLLFDLHGLVITTALCSLLIGGLIGAENAGLLPRPDFSVTITQWVAYTVIFGWTGSLTFAALQGMQRALARADNEIAERKQAEEALRASEERFRRLVESVTDYIYTVKVEAGRPVATTHSPSCVAVTGYTPEEYAADPHLWYRMVYEEDRPAVTQQATQVLSGEAALPLEHRLIHKDGSIRWVRNTPVLRRDDQGHLVAYDGLIADITERKRAEEALERRSNELAALYDTVLNVTAQLELPRLLHTIVERATALLKGYGGVLYFYRTEHDDLELVLVSGLKPDYTGSVLKRGEGISGKVLESGQPMIVSDYRTWSGRASIYEGAPFEAVIAVPVKWDEQVLGIINVLGEPGAGFNEEGARLLTLFANEAAVALVNARLYESVQQELTDRKRAEETLRESEERFSKAFRASPNAMTISRMADGTIIEVNDMWEKAFGYSRAESVDTSSIALGIWYDPAMRQEAIQQLRKTGSLRDFETEVRRKTGEVRQVSLSSERLEIGGEQCLLTIIQDITERKRAEETRQRYAVRLEVLHQIDQAILAAQSSEAIARVALAHTQQLVPFWWAAVTMFDFDAHEITVLATYPEGKAKVSAGTVLPLDTSEIAEKLQRRGNVHIVEDIIALPQPTLEDQALLAEGVRSCINVPLTAQGKLIGAINLGSEEPDFFGEEQIEISREVADSLAVALQNARLIETEQTQLKRESALLTLARVVGSTLDLNQVLQIILTHLRLFVPYDSATIQLLEGDTLRTIAATGFEREAGVQNFVYPLAKFSLNRQLIKEQRPIRIDDVKADDRFIVVPGAERVRAFIGIPLLAQDMPFGVITLDGHKPAQFTETDVELAVAVAVHAAIAINNAHMFEQVQAGHEQLHTLSRRLLEVQEVERRFLARELHDEIGQVMLAIKTNLETMQLASKSVKLKARLADSAAIVSRALEQIRTLALDLRPSLLDDFGLMPTLEWYLERQAMDAPFEINFQTDLPDMRFSPDIEASCFRVTQAAMTNIARHAQATQVDVTLRWLPATQILELSVRDNGIGFDVSAALEHARQGESLGLLGMQERVQLIGGQLAIESAPGRGTEIRARVPIKQT
jgi:PAS domain S-box-containing protein